MKKSKFWFKYWLPGDTVRPVTWQGYLVSWGSLILELLIFGIVYGKVYEITNSFLISLLSGFVVCLIIGIIICKIFSSKLPPKSPWARAVSWRTQ